MSKEVWVVLDATNSRLYRAKGGRTKEARIRWEAAEYVLTWGTQQFAGPHVVVTDPSGDYGVDLEIFFTTHQAISEQKDHYIKVVKVRAMRVSESMTLVTSVKGTMEMTAVVSAGAYVVQNPTGEQYSMAEDEFELRYELDE
jgi:hypothetical protein